MLDKRCFHQKFIAILLLLPLVLLADVAAGRVRSTSRRAGGQGG